MFQKSVLRRYIQSVEQNVVDEAWKRFEDTFLDQDKQKNIRESIEIQYQEGFCRDLFCHVLGYTINPEPNYNLKTEQKNEACTAKYDNRSADAAVILNGNTRVIIELKGCDTLDLSKVEPQAFGYKAHHPGCRYVVISNFEWLRFYIDTAEKYLEFHLFKLTRDAFTLLYLCLALTQIEADVPARIKAESLTNETEITASFYKDYSVFKRDLFNNIVEHNEGRFDKLLLFRKTQKLLDRLLFILFCEDRGLLKANTVASIIHRWKTLKGLDAYQPLYSLFKRHFVYIDIGHKDDEITVFAYNGGLFKTDEVLDALVIDDDILLGTQKLSNYDFESDVSVDILGHIFEHSLTEIEEIQNEIIGASTPTKEKPKEKAKNTGKRKKDGVFYTPSYITKYIVENTVGRLCAEKKKELGIDDETYAERNYRNTQKEKETKKRLAEVLDTYRQWLIGLKICDPACGSGAFLNAALQFLQNEHHLLDIYKAHIYGATLILSDVDSAILENNLYGVDINEESVEIARLSLWLHTARRGRKLTSLNNNIKCGNSLIDDPAVAGDKAFNWQNEFPEIFANGGFDVVIGNPPYGAELSDIERKLLENRYHLNCTDTACIFMALGHNLISNRGILGYIVPKPFLYASNWKSTRELLISYITDIVDCKKVWNEVKLEQVITILDKETHADYHSSYRNGAEIVLCSTIDKQVCAQYGLILNQITEQALSIATKIINNSCKMKEICSNRRGGMYQKYISETPKGIAVIGGGQLIRYGVYDIKGYVDKRIAKDNGLIQSNSILAQNIIAYIENPRPHIKIISTTLPQNNQYCIVDTVNQLVFSPNINHKFILCILNSRLMSWYVYRYIFGCAIRTMHFDSVVTDRIPIRLPDLSRQQPLIDLGDAQLAANDKLQAYAQKFLNRVQSTLGASKITEKLGEFYKYDFNVFMSELKKQKIKLSLREQDEWEEYFDSYRQDCTRLCIEIAENDRKIDELVYDLYGLTEEERAIVRNS